MGQKMLQTNAPKGYQLNAMARRIEYYNKTALRRDSRNGGGQKNSRVCQDNYINNNKAHNRKPQMCWCKIVFSLRVTI